MMYFDSTYPEFEYLAAFDTPEMKQLLLSEYTKVKEAAFHWFETQHYEGQWDMAMIKCDNDWDIVKKYNSLAGNSDNPIVQESLVAQSDMISVIEELTPVHIQAAAFSIIGPHSKITGHRGYHYRTHIPIYIPKGDCGFEIVCDNGNSFQYHWDRTIVFNDYNYHRAWNNTSMERLVLLVDIQPNAEQKALVDSSYC